MAAHRDDAFGTHLLRREHAEESDGTVTHDNDRRTGFHVRRNGGKPAGAHHVRQCEHAGDVVGIGHVASRDECTVGQRDAHARCLRADHRLALLTRGLVTVPAMRTRVVRCEERADDELSPLQ